jgi:uncharacterized protein YecE (DUF72 family)
MGKSRIGLSGWSYDEWDGGFYPEDLPADGRLKWVSGRFDTVEVNGTFYSLTSPASVRKWREQTPSSFIFAIKGSRYITHTKRLREPATALANFFASGLLELGGRLGPILWQLPPNLEYDPDVLGRFLQLLPHDTDAAASLARRHDDRVEEVSFGDGSNHRLRHVIEFRDPSFLQREAVATVKRHGCALACSHSSEWPLVSDVTAGFVYIRLHGPDEIYASGYSDGELRRWGHRIETWRSGGQVDDLETIADLAPPPRQERDVYVYFDNTAAGHAPEDARRLQHLTRS